MKKLVIIIFSGLFISFYSCNNQHVKEEEIKNREDTIITFLSGDSITENLPIDEEEEDIKDASFPKGEKELEIFIKNNKWHYDVTLANARNESKKEKIIVSFIVNENGKISNIIISNSDEIKCNSCKEEAIRLVKIMPNWIPMSIKKENKTIYSKSHQAIEIEL